MSHTSQKHRFAPSQQPDEAAEEPRPSPTGRRPKHNLSSWTVTDDWPEKVPITEAEIEVFEQWFGDVFDELLGPADPTATPKP